MSDGVEICDLCFPVFCGCLCWQSVGAYQYEILSFLTSILFLCPRLLFLKMRVGKYVYNYVFVVRVAGQLVENVGQLRVIYMSIRASQFCTSKSFAYQKVLLATLSAIYFWVKMVCESKNFNKNI